MGKSGGSTWLLQQNGSLLVVGKAMKTCDSVIFSLAFRVLLGANSGMRMVPGAMIA